MTSCPAPARMQRVLEEFERREKGRDGRLFWASRKTREKDSTFFDQADVDHRR